MIRISCQIFWSVVFLPFCFIGMMAAMIVFTFNIGYELTANWIRSE